MKAQTDITATTDWQWLRNIVAEAIRKPSEQLIDVWLRANVSLDTTSPIQGPYDVSNSPQLRDPLRSFQDENVRMVTTVGPNQGGRTKAMEGASLWAVVNRPGPMQWNTYKDESAREFAEQRWWPAALSCAAVVNKLPSKGTGKGEGRHRERIRGVIFTDGMPFKIQGCAESNLEEKSIMTQFNDECWQWPVGRLEIAHIRCNVAYAWNYKVWNGSIPGVDGDDFDLLFRNGTRREWHWRCLKCGRKQIPMWGKPGTRGGLQWERDSTTKPNNREWDYEAVQKTVRYSCAYCAADYSDTSKSRRQLNDGASYQQLNTGAPDWHHSYRFNILSVNWPGITWGQWVSEFLKAVDRHRRYGEIESLRKFWTRRMTEPWDESKHIVGRQRTAISDYAYMDNGTKIYQKGQWDGETIRFMSCDKQEWGYPYVIRACGPNVGSRLIDRGVDENTCLSSYDEIEARAKDFGIAPQCVLIDAGFEPRDVYAAAANRGWTCMRGVDRVEAFRHMIEMVDPRTRIIKRMAIELPYSEEKWSDPFTGTEQQQLNRRIRFIRTAPRLARRYDWMNLPIKNLLSVFKQGMGLYWGIPDDVGPEYIRQINAETRHSITTPRGKRTDWWSNTNAQGTGTKRPNHAWDCECQILVAMCLQKLIDLSDWVSEESIAGDTISRNS